jgi:hypothetical protein
MLALLQIVEAFYAAKGRASIYCLLENQWLRLALDHVAYPELRLW